MRLRLAFLSRGLTKATLSLSGKIPDVSDLFIILVSIVITDGRISFNSVVGMGSKSQLLLGEVLIIRILILSYWGYCHHFSVVKGSHSKSCPYLSYNTN